MWQKTIDFLLDAAKIVIYTVVILFLTFSVDYLVIEHFFGDPFKLSVICTTISILVVEGIAYILIGIKLLHKRVERTQAIYILPDMAPRILTPPIEVVHKARPLLGAALIVTGIILFILGMFILPIRYNL